jgi:hypothetical protein
MTAVVMIWFEFMLGATLGAVGACWHLWIVWQRARWSLGGRGAQAWLGFPLGLLGPALAVVVAAQLSARAAWATLAGILLVRAWFRLRTRTS